jgi:pimeloyl-ACP methyl ester carboxylesterase
MPFAERGVIERRIEVGGFSTRYLEAGDPSAAPVVLLHDGAWGGSSSTTWLNIIGRLAERRRVLAPDLLGFGGTDKVVFLDRSPYAPRMRHVAQFVEACAGGKPPHLVGTSFGGSLALRMIAESATPVRSAVSISGTGGPWRKQEGLAELGRWDGTEADLRRVVAHLIDERSPYFEAQVQERLRWATEPGHYRAVAAVGIPLPEALAASRPADSWPEDLASVGSPILLVAGTRDELVDADWTDHLRAAQPNIEVVQLDCGHEPSIDNPELLAVTLSAYFDEVESAN